MSTIDISKISNEIAKMMAQYNTEIEEKLETVQEKIAKEGVKELKATSPKLYGDYAKGWRQEKTYQGRTIYNKTDYQLTHLLENGYIHWLTGKRVGKSPHIEKVEEMVIKKYVDTAKKVLSE